MMKRSMTCLAILTAVLATLPPAAAQELTTGTIAGKVSDPTGRPIAGAIIIVTSPFGTRTGDTDADGNFILPFLRPASYTIRVEAAGGFTTVIQNDVVVGLSQRTRLNFTLEPGKTETVVVRGKSPLVDPRSTATGTNLNYEEFANAVPIGRSFTDTYAVAAGVVSGLGTGQGNYSISGSSGLENAYLIDGVNVTNTGYGGIGAYNIVYGSLGTGVTSEFLDEVQIKTGGFEAEFGQALGGIINTIVKSGTNDFKGSVAHYATPGSLRSAYRTVSLDSGATNLVDENVNDFAFSVGGPIRKDRLFYFFAYNPVVTTQGRMAQSIVNPESVAFSGGATGVFDETASSNAFGSIDGVTLPLEAFPSAGTALERKRTANNYAAKLSWMVSPKHQLELTFFGDPAEGRRGPQRNSAARFTDFATGGGQSRISYGAHNQSLKWNAVFGPKFFMEAQIARHDGKFRETSVVNDHAYLDLRNNLEFFRGATTYDPVGSGDPADFVPITLTPVANRRGGIGFISNQDDVSTQFLVKLTNVFGRHEVRYGVQYDDINYRETGTYSGPSFNVGLPVSYFDAGTMTIFPVDEFDNSTCVPGPCSGPPDGLQDFLFLPTLGGAVVDVRNGLGADMFGNLTPTNAFDSANRFRVTRARLGPSLPPTKADETSFFIQDTWAITPRVTLRAGLRQTSETIEGAGSFSLGFGTQSVVDSFGVSHRIFTSGTSSYAPDRYTFDRNWAPRLGVTWDVLGNGKSRLYGNWGRYFERVPNDLAVRAFSNEVGISLQEFSDRNLTSPRFAGGAGSCTNSSGVDTGLGGCATSFPVFAQGVEPTSVAPGTRLPYVDELSAGFAFEVTPNSSLEVRAIFRTQGRALEDVQVNSIEQIQNFYYGTGYGYPYDPFGGSLADPTSNQFPAATFGPYVLANPGTDQVPSGALFPFPKAERDYKALELAYTRRFSDNWQLHANYRFSRLTGNYEGLFRNDNGQSDPNITSLWDFPGSPLLASQFESGDLPADVSHVLRVFPSYTFANKLRLGASFSWHSGVPRTSLLAHPSYQNAGEIPGIDPVYAYWSDADAVNTGCDSSDGTPCTLATTTSLGAALADPNNAIGTVFLRSYTPVKRGNLGRTPGLVNLDLHGDYPLQIGKTQLRLMLDVFNVFGTQKVTSFDDFVELGAGITNPDFLEAVAFQQPRSWRLAARWDF
jgi:hypothetical protein